MRPIRVTAYKEGGTDETITVYFNPDYIASFSAPIASRGNCRIVLVNGADETPEYLHTVLYVAAGSN
jgi:hypothetical protein